MVAFGDYADTITHTLITKEAVGAASAHPELAKTKGKRICIF
jgi:hypothetical protein